MGGRGGWRVEGVVSGPEVIDENLIRDFLRVGVEWEGNKREEGKRGRGEEGKRGRGEEGKRGRGKETFPLILNLSFAFTRWGEVKRPVL